MKNLLLLFSFILLISTNISAQSKDAKISDAIRSVMNAQVTAWNAGDIEGFMGGYWKSEQMKFVSGDNVSRGWQAALDRYKKNYDSKAKMGVLTFSELEVNVLSKDAAVVLGNWSLVREKDNPKGKFTLIFRKFKDGWKIVHDHTS
jgi:ketosteroid isomerase-like protein